MQKSNLPKNSLLVVPDKKGKYPLAIIFGGMYYANPSWVLEQVTPKMLDEAILVLIPYTESYSEIVPEAKKEIANKGYDISGISLMGFSAGGNDVLQNYSDDFYFIGLIDPSLTQSGLNLPIDNRWGMMFNDKNWGGYPSIKSLFKPYADKINENDGFALGTNLKHEDIPKEFFKEFESKILKGAGKFSLGDKSGNKSIFLVGLGIVLIGIGIYSIIRFSSKN